MIRLPFPAGNASQASMHDRQAGAGATDADRSALMRQYEALRLKLVDLHRSPEPDMVAIDEAIDGLARLQSDIKATGGLVGNNPIEV